MSLRNRSLPSLADHRPLRLTAFAVLYAAQGIPWGLFTVGFPSWLASKGFSTADIAVFVGVAVAPWSFKLIAGPLMDRWGFLEMGRRRPWVLGAQLGILVSFALVASVSGQDLVPGEEIPDALWQLAGMAFLINCFCAVQDVAVDGMAIDVLDPNERARANAFMFGGQLLGISFGSSAGGYALTVLGLGPVAALGSLATLIIMCFPLLLRERAGERLLPWSQGAASERSMSLKITHFGPLFRDLSRLLLLPLSVALIFLEFLSRAANGIVGTYLPVYWVQEFGWSNIAFNNYLALAGLVSAGVGLAISPFVDRFGPMRFLPSMAAAKLVVFAALGWLPDAPASIIVGLVFANVIAGQVFTIAVIAMFMSICSVRVAASQFSIYMALSNVSLTVGTLLLAPLSEWLDPHAIFYAAASFYLVFLLLWPRLRAARGATHTAEPGLPD